METFKIKGLAVDKIPGKGLKILFVHGSNGGSWYWHKYMNYFYDKGFEVYANNLRGHAPNPEIEELGKVSIYEYIQDTKYVVHEIKPDIIIGHSMGGLITQKLLEEYKFKAGIMACSAPPKGVKYHLRKIFKFGWYSMQQLQASKNDKPLKMIYKMARDFALNNMPEEKAKFYFERFVPESSLVAHEVGKKPVVDVDESKVKCPVLAIGAKKDYTIGPKTAKLLAKKYNGDFFILKENAHMFMIEQGSEEIADQIIDWIKRKVR